MAKIILNVELAKSNVVKNLKELEAGIQGIGKSLGNVKVNKNLTAQLNALTRQYNALAKAAKEAQKVDNKQAIEKEKLAKATAQASTAKINEQKATVQLQTAQVRLTKAQESGTKVVKKATEENEKHRQSILSMAQGFFQWQMAATLVMKPLQMVRNAWASINETLVKTEDSVISLQRVLNDDSLDDSTISGKLYNLAQRYGQTFDNVNDIAQNFARTGMSWNETIQATESALLALNVAELDATQASDGMIAIMQQFGYEASELTGIIDMLNKTADNHAVTTDKILTALQRTGSSAKNANLSLAETVGLITALSESTGRSGENLGTAINSLIQYSSKDSALDTFASLDQNTADIVDKYRKGGATILDVWMAVSGVINNMDSRQEGILAGLGNSADITDLNQELQDELGDIFESVNDVYGTANTFRKNYFIALLGNMQTVQDAIETASDASGYSQKENEKYLDTYTAKVNTLKAKWEEVANDEQGILGIKKDLVEMGIGVLDFVDDLGGIKTVLSKIGIIVATIIATTKGAAIVAGLSKIGIVLKQLTIDALPNAIGAWKAFAAGIVSTNTAIQASIPLLGLVLTAINFVVGAVNASNQAQEEARQQAIANYEANKKEADSLLELYNRFEELESITNKTTDQQKEFNTVTESIVENLGYEAYKLKDLEKGSREYLQVLKEITKEKLLSYAQDAQAAANAQKEEYNKYSNQTIIESSEIDRADLERMGVSSKLFYSRGRYFYNGTGSAIGDVAELENVIENLYNNGYGETEAYSNLYSHYKKAKAVSETYLKAAIENLFFNTASNNGVDYAQSNFDSLIGDLIDENGITSDYLLNFVKKYGKDVFGIKEEPQKQVDPTKTWEEQIKGVVFNYSELLDVLNGVRNTEEEIVDLEEKKQAIQEKELELEKARQALEDAKNNKTVYQYNASTGRWERVADAKAIADAEEGVKKAEKGVENAEKAYEDALWKSVEGDIKEGSLSAKEILDKISAFPQLQSALLSWLKDEGYNVPNDFVFGSSKTIPSVTNGMSSNVSNSSNDNRTYMVNGVPITQEQANQYTVAEILEQVANMPN